MGQDNPQGGVAVMRCPIDHVAIKKDLVEWSKLDFIGVQPDMGTADEKYPPLELRNCTCGTTLARVMAEETP